MLLSASRRTCLVTFELLYNMHSPHLHPGCSTRLSRQQVWLQLRRSGRVAAAAAMLL